MYIHKICSYSQDYSEIILIQQKLIPAKKKKIPMRHTKQGISLNEKKICLVNLPHAPCLSNSIFLPFKQARFFISHVLGYVYKSLPHTGSNVLTSLSHVGQIQFADWSAFITHRL